jgi:hypothetical protein
MSEQLANSPVVNGSSGHCASSLVCARAYMFCSPSCAHSAVIHSTDGAYSGTASSGLIASLSLVLLLLAVVLATSDEAVAVAVVAAAGAAAVVVAAVAGGAVVSYHRGCTLVRHSTNLQQYIQCITICMMHS